MELENIKTLLEIEKYKSFSKVADKLFLSKNAVKKRIDQLENDLECKLVVRSPQGVQLTKAGKYLCTEMKKIIDRSDQVFLKTQEIGREKEDYLRIGALSTFANELLIGNWGKDYFYTSGPAKTRMLFFEGNPMEKAEMYRELGNNIDLIVDCENEAPDLKAEFKKLSDNHICFGVARSFLQEEKLTSGNCSVGLIVPKTGVSVSWDNAIQKVSRLYPSFRLEQVDQYDMMTINECISENKAILMIESWISIHPYLKAVPLKESLLIAYGVYYRSGNHVTEKFITEISRKSVT